MKKTKAKTKVKSKSLNPKLTPWDYLKSFRTKNYIEDLSGFSPFLTAMNYSAGNSQFCFIANALNKLGQHKLPKRAFYDFYYYSVPKNHRFIKYPKSAKDPKEIKHIQEWFGCDEKSAKTALEVIDKKELKEIKDFFENRGFIK